jgi:hypothetical protein
LLIGLASFAQQPGNAPYQDLTLTPERRAADLVSRMTLEEKVLQMQNSAPAIPRLGVGVFNYWNEALHGVASGRATVFPEPIGLGASFDSDLVHRIADAISTEARAKYHEAQRHDPIPEVPPGNSPGSAPRISEAWIKLVRTSRHTAMSMVALISVGPDGPHSVPKRKAMLATIPPYLLEPDGTLKEWAWPTLQEHYTHRHVSHLYGAWPGDEIDPDRTPQLARAAEIADRRRTVDALATAVAGETLPAYGRCHRALVGARLKDNVIVDVQLRQLMEQGYVSTAVRCSREPYGPPVPDALGGIPTIITEMLAYSRPGVIEVLPALPPSLVKGSIHGMLVRTFARLDKLAWDMDARTVDLTVTSVKKQDVTLIARQGIESIAAPAGILAAPLRAGKADIDVHLPENRPVTFHLKLGHHQPLDWVNQVSVA